MWKTFTALAVLASLESTTSVKAEEWPTRPLTMINPFAPGGPHDVVARLFAQRMGEILGQSVIVENVGGAGGMNGASRVAKAEVPANVLEKEREIYKAQAAAAGKPAPVQDKIAEGKLKQYYSEVCLLEQPFVRDNDKTVGQLIQEKIALIKENIVVRRFARFRVGEEGRATSAETAPGAQG